MDRAEGLWGEEESDEFPAVVGEFVEGSAELRFDAVRMRTAATGGGEMTDSLLLSNLERVVAVVGVAGADSVSDS